MKNCNWNWNSNDESTPRVLLGVHSSQLRYISQNNLPPGYNESIRFELVTSSAQINNEWDSDNKHAMRVEQEYLSKQLMKRSKHERDVGASVSYDHRIMTILSSVNNKDIQLLDSWHGVGPLQVTILTIDKHASAKKNKEITTTLSFLCSKSRHMHGSIRNKRKVPCNVHTIPSMM